MAMTRTKPRPIFRVAVAERPVRGRIRLGPDPLEVINAMAADLQQKHGEAFKIRHVREARTQGLWFLSGTLEVKPQ